MIRLPREFMWTDVKSMDNFLKDPLNKVLYKTYEEIKIVQSNNKIANIPDVKIFNELYFLCISLKFGNITIHDLDSIILSDLGIEESKYLLKSMVYAVFNMQEPDLKPIYFLDLYNMLSNRKIGYFDYYSQFTIKHKIKYQTDFSPRPEEAKLIVKKIKDWENLTCNYDRNDIKRILSLWKEESDKLIILDAIEAAFNKHHNYDAGSRSSDGHISLFPIEEDYFQKFRENILKHKGFSSPVEYEIELSEFASYVNNKKDASVVIEILHQYIDGKTKPQAASLPIRAAMEVNLISRPTWEVFKKEFKNCTIGRSSFEKYTSQIFDVKTNFRGEKLYESVVEKLSKI